jgi:hypothetical protein
MFTGHAPNSCQAKLGIPVIFPKLDMLNEENSENSDKTVGWFLKMITSSPRSPSAHGCEKPRFGGHSFGPLLPGTPRPGARDFWMGLTCVFCCFFGWITMVIGE